MTKSHCKFCEREIGENPITGNLRAHNWTREQHESIWPNAPFVDARCPGSGSGQQIPR